MVILDAVDGTFPSATPNVYDRSKDSAAAYQEERRLFYVAMTRARNELVLVRPKGERTSFVDEVLPRKRGADQAAVRVRGAAADFTPPAIATLPATTVPPTTTTPPTTAAPPTTTALPATPARKPSEARYDVDSWDVMETRRDGRRVVTNGDMDAMVSPRWVSPYWGRIAIEMVVDLEPGVVAEVAEHVDELSWGADTFVLCLSACAQQAAGNVRVSPQGDDDAQGDKGVVAEVGRALAPCLDAAAGLMERGVALTMTVRDQNSELIGREVERVDLPALTISLSGKALPVY